MPRGVYNRKKKSKAKVVNGEDAPKKGVRQKRIPMNPEIIGSITTALTNRLPSNIIPYVTIYGAVRLFRLRRNVLKQWMAQPLSTEETDALLKG